MCRPQYLPWWLFEELNSDWRWWLFWPHYETILDHCVAMWFCRGPGWPSRSTRSTRRRPPWCWRRWGCCQGWGYRLAQLKTNKHNIYWNSSESILDQFGKVKTIWKILMAPALVKIIFHDSMKLEMFLLLSSLFWLGMVNTFSNFSCMFLNPNNFFQFEF